MNAGFSGNKGWQVNALLLLRACLKIKFESTIGIGFTHSN